MAVLAAFGARFLFVTGQWEPVRTNLTLLMMGTFPRDEQWRVVVQVYLLCAAAGLAWGGLTASARDRARDAGMAFSRAGVRDGVRRWWPVFVLLAVLLGMTRTWLPLGFVASALAVGVVARRVMEALGEVGRRLAWFGAGICALAGWQVLSGTGGIAWWWGGALVATAVIRITRNVRTDARWQPLARLALIAGAVAVVQAVYTRFDFSGVGWDDWSGFQLNLVAAAASIVLAFPVGLAAAVGRRSKLPAVRLLSVGYIEVIRGVPLITLLFMGDLFLGFFLPTEDPLSKVTRAIAVMTLFTGAYLAEIVRGGLQAVPRGAGGGRLGHRSERPPRAGVDRAAPGPAGGHPRPGGAVHQPVQGQHTAVDHRSHRDPADPREHPRAAGVPRRGHRRDAGVRRLRVLGAGLHDVTGEPAAGAPTGGWRTMTETETPSTTGTDTHGPW